MFLQYVVEKIEGGLVTHIGAEHIREAQEILRSIPKQHRGSVYPLYLKDILVNKKEKED